MRTTTVIPGEELDLELEFELDEQDDPQDDGHITRELHIRQWIPVINELDCAPVMEAPESPRAARHQDTEQIDGEEAIHPPPGSELVQRGLIQG